MQLDGVNHRKWCAPCLRESRAARERERLARRSGVSSAVATTK